MPVVIVVPAVVVLNKASDNDVAGLHGLHGLQGLQGVEAGAGGGDIHGRTGIIVGTAESTEIGAFDSDDETGMMDISGFIQG